jgi:hypothetical protein
MVLIEANKPKRLLHFRYIKHVTRDELLKGRPDLEAMLADFPNGFRLLTDLSELEAMDSNCMLVIGEIMELLEAKGLEKVVRLIPDPSKDIGLNIISLFHYSKKVRPITCDTLEEALKILEM